MNLFFDLGGGGTPELCLRKSDPWVTKPLKTRNTLENSSRWTGRLTRLVDVTSVGVPKGRQGAIPSPVAEAFRDGSGIRPLAPWRSLMEADRNTPGTLPRTGGECSQASHRGGSVKELPSLLRTPP